MIAGMEIYEVYPAKMSVPERSPKASISHISPASPVPLFQAALDWQHERQRKPRPIGFQGPQTAENGWKTARRKSGYAGGWRNAQSGKRNPVSARRTAFCATSRGGPFQAAEHIRPATSEAKTIAERRTLFALCFHSSLLREPIRSKRTIYLGDVP